MRNYLIIGAAICGLFIWPKFMFGVIVGVILSAFVNGVSITSIKYSDKNEGSHV